jgi:hypothetical protein
MSDSQRFSLNYALAAEPGLDSQRARTRILAHLQDQYPRAIRDLPTFLGTELGIHPSSTAYGYKWRDFFAAIDLNDFLDTLTLSYQAIKHTSQDPSTRDFYSRKDYEPQYFVQFVNRVLSETNLNYIMNDDGGVRFKVDEAHQIQRASIIQHLDETKFLSVKTLMIDCYEKLESQPPNTLLAVRSCFDAHEALVKIHFTDVARLQVGEVQKKIRPAIEKHTEATEMAAVSKHLEAYKSWVIASQEFRHASGSHAPSAPSMDFSVLHVSTGTAYLRWLLQRLPSNTR